MMKQSALVAFFLLAACSGEGSSSPSSAAPEDPAPSSVGVESAAADADDSVDDAGVDTIDQLAEDFVKLALGAGVHDSAFVDAYHGPKEWAEAAKQEARPLSDLEADAKAMLDRAGVIRADEPGVRAAMLEKLIRAAHARIRMAGGVEFAFDEETRLLYDAVAPQYDIEEFYAALEDVDALLPGDEPLHERMNAFRDSLAIPSEKLDAVFEAAIAECRERTIQHYVLPTDERFSTEFVTDKPWSGYNWYQGDFESLIQVNTDLPVIIDRAVDLGCHEGYPGHHTWNVMLERDLLRDKGWIEYSVYPLFSPLSITAEGSANYGIELAFPGEEKVAFERDVLYPIAGLDPAQAEKLDRLNKARRKLSHSRNHIARAYLDGEVDREEAIRMLMEFGLQSRERAEQGIDFIETYRGYVINYNLGRDLVEGYVERKSADDGDRWAAFETLLTTPLAASDISSVQ
ncbi:MAG: hypothetical protein AAGD92_14410 [Pseudomonadota bacterium]